jgi:hypothetical protein
VPATHLRTLIRRLHPGVSVRQLEARAGLTANSIAYWLKPSTIVRRVPEREVIDDIADALNCDPRMVLHAFMEDAGLPVGDPPPLEPADEELLHVVHQLRPRDRATVLTVARSLLNGTAN